MSAGKSQDHARKQSGTMRLSPQSPPPITFPARAEAILTGEEAEKDLT